MKVIITDCDHDSIDIEKKVFKDAGMEVELKQAITEDEVIEQCQDAEIFIVQYAKITEKVMDNCPKLKYVVRYGVGVDTNRCTSGNKTWYSDWKCTRLWNERSSRSCDLTSTCNGKKNRKNECIYKSRKMGLYKFNSCTSF